MIEALPRDARVLIVRTGALGDIVHALPVVAALGAARADVSIDWLVDARYAAILSLVDGVRTRVVVRAAAAAADSAGERRFAGRRGLVGAIGYLRRQGYAAALDLQGLIKSAVLARASGAARVIGFASGQLRERHAGLAYTETVVGPEGGHVIAKNAAMLPALGVAAPLRPAFPWRDLPSPVAGDVAAMPAVAAAGGFALLNPGAAWPNKRWPAARFGALAARLGHDLRLPSVVTWGGSERALAEAVVGHSEGQAVLSPPTGLHDLLALCRRARLVVSGDTGPLHVAASVAAPLVGLFGPTRPERNGPWDPADESVSRAATCVCFHKRECLRGRACVDDIAVDEVLEACRRRLAATPR
ncbi:MAG: glycosyltransferase family 9 protein [Vicinamibacterales bacterium]